MEPFDDHLTQAKKRHGCLTAWLILIILASGFVSVLYLFAGELVSQGTPGGIPQSMLTLLAILGVGNVIAAILLFQWKKAGFFIFVFTYLGSFVINMYVGLGLAQSLMGVLGLAILFAVLQIKSGRISGWENLE